MHAFGLLLAVLIDLKAKHGDGDHQRADDQIKNAAVGHGVAGQFWRGYCRMVSRAFGNDIAGGTLFAAIRVGPLS